MMVEQTRFGFRKAFVPHDKDLALKVAREKSRYSRIQILSLELLPLQGFMLKMRNTGVIHLGGSMEEIIGSFNATTRKHIHRTYRDAGFRFQVSPGVTDNAYALLGRFLKARGRPHVPRTDYEGAIEFLAYVDEEPVSGIFLFPSTPVGLNAGVFSKRHEDCSHSEYLRVGNASKRLMAEVCAWGASHGMTDIDMGGLNLEEAEKSGISNFKMGFNPIVTQQYVYSYSSPTFGVLARLMVLFRKLQSSLH